MIRFKLGFNQGLYNQRYSVKTSSESQRLKTALIAKLDTRSRNRGKNFENCEPTAILNEAKVDVVGKLSYAQVLQAEVRNLIWPSCIQTSEIKVSQNNLEMQLELITLKNEMTTFGVLFLKKHTVLVNVAQGVKTLFSSIYLRVAYFSNMKYKESQ